MQRELQLQEDVAGRAFSSHVLAEQPAVLVGDVEGRGPETRGGAMLPRLVADMEDAVVVVPADAISREIFGGTSPTRGSLPSSGGGDNVAMLPTTGRKI